MLYKIPDLNTLMFIVIMLNNYFYATITLNKYIHFLYIQIIHRTLYLIKTSGGNMGLYFGGFTARMAHHTLDIPKVVRVFDKSENSLRSVKSVRILNFN